MKKLVEGKTKIIYQDPENNEQVIIFSKDDITSGDGARHDIIPGKGALLTHITSDVFELLKKNNIPVSYIQQVSENEFKSLFCKMIPLEVVIRRHAYGSFIKRNKEYKKGDCFKKPIVELYLKTKDKLWENTNIPVDDPFIIVDADTLNLFHPSTQLNKQRSFLNLKTVDVVPQHISLETITSIAESTFLILEREWKKLDCVLVDMKIEFGILNNGNLVISDVIDNDSWRLLKNGMHLDKQLYREGADLKEVKEKYEIVKDLANKMV